MPTENFIGWVKRASLAEKTYVAKRAGTSVAMLYQLASGRRNASPDLAHRIVNSARKLELLSPLQVGDISEVCESCPHFRKECRNGEE